MDLESWLRQAWDWAPLDVRRALYPRLRPLYIGAGHIAELRSLLAPVSTATVTGRLMGDSATVLRLAVAGTPLEVRSISRLLLGTVPPGPLERTPLRHIHRFMASGLAGADVLLIAAPAVARFLLPPSLLVLPESVEVVLAVAPALRRWHAARQPLGTYLRKVRASGFEFAAERGLAALGRFYHEFYRPYLESRLGRWCDPRPWRFYARHASHIELLWVLHDGEKIAAQAAIHHEDRYRFLDVGHRHGSALHLGKGAGHALYAAALWRAAELGYEEIDHGPERPLLANPQLRYKLAWGAELRPNPWSRRMLAVGLRDPGAAAARRLLETCPLLRWNGGRLLGVVEAGASAARLDELARRHQGAGIDGFAPWPEGATRWLAGSPPDR